MAHLTPEEQEQQIRYRDARFTGQYDGIWQSVGKCVFCDLRSKYVIYEEAGVVLTIQLFAYIDGHLMIVPRRHVRSTKELTQAEWEAVRKLTYIAKKLVKDVHGIKGLQFIQKDGSQAQSTVTEHIHFHCVPFDAPDLLEWHYRKLKYTPLENAQLYQASGKKIAAYRAKYEDKYSQDLDAHGSTPNSYAVDWSNLAFSSKKPINQLKATFIAAPRELSLARFRQLIKQYLPKGHIVLGLAKETHVLGFEDQPQFKMLKLEAVQKLIAKVNATSPKHKIYTLSYAQRETKYLLEKLEFDRVVLVNGSWKYSFHTQPSYFELTRRAVPYEMVSPFCDEAEARAYEAATWPAIAANLAPIRPKVAYVEADIIAQAANVAKCSYDYGFQTGVALGRQTSLGYYLVTRTFNSVVPFQTYALHYGSARETNFSPPHDLNHYDTIHAEVALLIKAQKDKIDLKGTSMFINLLPCPSCARMLSQTDIAEFIYAEDHSDGYAIKLFEKAGKIVRRVLPTT